MFGYDRMILFLWKWQGKVIFSILILSIKNESETKPGGLSLWMVEQSHPTLLVSKDDIAHPLTNLGEGNESDICDEITNPLTNLEKQTSNVVFVENDGVDHFS